MIGTVTWRPVFFILEKANAARALSLLESESSRGTRREESACDTSAQGVLKDAKA